MLNVTKALQWLLLALWRALLVFHSSTFCSVRMYCVTDTAHSMASPRPVSESHFSHIYVSAYQFTTQYLKIQNVTWMIFANTSLLHVNVFWLLCKQYCLSFLSFKVYNFLILWLLTWRSFEVLWGENTCLIPCLLFFHCY